MDAALRGGPPSTSLPGAGGRPQRRPRLWSDGVVGIHICRPDPSVLVDDVAGRHRQTKVRLVLKFVCRVKLWPYRLQSFQLHHAVGSPVPAEERDHQWALASKSAERTSSPSSLVSSNAGARSPTLSARSASPDRRRSSVARCMVSIASHGALYGGAPDSNVALNASKRCWRLMGYLASVYVGHRYDAGGSGARHVVCIDRSDRTTRSPKCHGTRRHLRYFRAVAESKGFREAARQPHVVQPALSQTVSDLARYGDGGAMSQLRRRRLARRAHSDATVARRDGCEARRHGRRDGILGRVTTSGSIAITT